MVAPTRTLVLTRASEASEGGPPALQVPGWRVVTLPLIEIQPTQDSAPVHAVWHALPQWAALMFVSAAAVRHFFALRPADCAWRPGGRPRAWATGPGTAAALLAQGVASGSIDQPGPEAPQLDSEALWGVVGQHVLAGERVCVVRGGDAAGHAQGRDWLTRTLQAHAVGVDTVVVYRRMPAAQTAADQAGVLADADSVWVFNSSLAVAELQRLCPGRDWGQALALATHPRIGAAAQAAGFGQVRLIRPGEPALVSALAQLRSGS